MPTQQKVDQVNSIQGWIDKCTIAISTDHTGLNVTDMTLLRKSLRESGIEPYPHETNRSILIDELVEKFSEFLETSDDPKWEKIASNGRKFALENFNNDVAVTSLIQLIRDVIKEKELE